MRYAYPVTLEHETDGSGVTASFDGLPGATWGATEAEAMAHAEDLLVTSLAGLVEDGAPLPPPAPAAGRPLIAAPVLESLKLGLHEAMLGARLSNVELARRMGVDERTVRRLRDPLHRSHVGAVEAALRVLGRQVEVSVLAAE